LARFSLATPSALIVLTGPTIFISALMFGGLPGTLLDLALVNSFQLLTSAVLLDELDEKLREKFEISPKDTHLIRIRLEASAVIVTPDFSLAVIEDDPDDDRVLECAVAGKADYIVSGDRHLVKLGSYRGIPIMTARQFMDVVGTEG
ncbi:MAG TPA: putative toxin-antitoxin system toxin component, PIN family, partial [Acidobacteriaceae bacterium]|nr:putative toxin-antitoxin system toxin component, PIN family [Acidobacteriaceae bacterium]